MEDTVEPKLEDHVQEHASTSGCTTSGPLYAHVLPFFCCSSWSTGSYLRSALPLVVRYSSYTFLSTQTRLQPLASPCCYTVSFTLPAAYAAIFSVFKRNIFYLLPPSCHCPISLLPFTVKLLTFLYKYPTRNSRGLHYVLYLVLWHVFVVFK